MMQGRDDWSGGMAGERMTDQEDPYQLNAPLFSAGSSSGEYGLEMVEQQQSSSRNNDTTEEWRQEDQGLGNNSRRKRKAATCEQMLLGRNSIIIPFAIIVGILLIGSIFVSEEENPADGTETDSNLPTVEPTAAIDPKKLEQMKLKNQTIRNVLGAEYFQNNPQRQKALDWILHDDPQEDIILTNGKEEEEDSYHHSSHLIQRFALVSMYFQTIGGGPSSSSSSEQQQQQLWAYCNPPVGKQTEICYYSNQYYSVNQKKDDEIGTRWLSGAHECQWMGIYCDSDTKIVNRIQIFGNNMTGQIPADELVLLTDLRNLELMNNNFWGTLPSKVFTELNKTLHRVILSDNDLTGSIPPQLFLMPNLTAVNLGKNQLSGTIPAEVGQFSNIRWIDFDHNMLTGSIPEELYQATRLQDLLLQENQLTGTISTAIGSLSALIYARFDGNSLTSTIPSQIAVLSVLNDFVAKNTSLSGTIPEEIYDMESLKGLDLNGNHQITGTISTRIGMMTSLEWFGIADNNIGGTLPTQMALLTEMRHLFLDGNSNLRGSIPEAICSSTPHHGREFQADCTPTASEGNPAVFCPQDCCTRCCDAETKDCVEL